MNLRESMGIALGGIRANKLRSFLTLLGIIIGVASVIAVVSFVEGMNRYVSDKILNAGANVFWVDKYGIITSQEAWEDAMKRRDITPDDADALREGVAHASMVVAMASGNANARFQEQKRIEQKEEWQKQDQERDRARREKEGCQRQCASVHSLCKASCGSTSGCLGRCQSDAWSCKSSCR